MSYVENMEVLSVPEQKVLANYRLRFIQSIIHMFFPEFHLKRLILLFNDDPEKSIEDLSVLRLREPDVECLRNNGDYTFSLGFNTKIR